MEDTEPHPVESTESYLRRALVVWVGLWIVYNGLLLGVGMNIGTIGYLFGDRLGVRWPGISEVDVLFVIVFGAVANVFYMLGPLGECYACILYGRRIGGGRYFLFAVGMLFSLFLVLLLWAIYYTM